MTRKINKLSNKIQCKIINANTTHQKDVKNLLYTWVEYVITSTNEISSAVCK